MMMNYNTSSAEFKKYESALGSTFAAIKYISALARQRRASVHNCITESQAIAWVISGVEPDNVKLYYHNLKLRRQRARTYKNDRLSYIEDTEVRNSVSFSLDQSKEVGHLIYCYQDIYDESRKARVRILCNMIWDELRQIEMDDEL